jgi:4'-phosphopantetheinyl transferase
MVKLPVICIWTMRLDRLDETATAAWLPLLDETECLRAARFVFARHRVQFIAAHALVRAALSRLHRAPPAAWRFVADGRGKPSAWLGDAPAAVSFNLSHTEGMAGLAGCRGAGRAIGFDLEAAARTVDLAVADRFFAPPETAWLGAQAAPARPEGFLRLWTLKEAFIKATGKGLTQDLKALSFDPDRPRIRFSTALAERAADWWFEQRRLDGGFIAGVGVRRGGAIPVETRWVAVDPADLGIEGLRGCRSGAARRSQRGAGPDAPENGWSRTTPGVRRALETKPD